MDRNRQYEEMARTLFEAGEFVPLVCSSDSDDVNLELRPLPGRRGIALYRVSSEGGRVGIIKMTVEEARRFAAVLRGCADGLKEEEA